MALRAFVTVVLWINLSYISAPAQTPATDLVPTEDPGVARAVLMDKPNVRVLRVEIQPGATRRIHTHDDVRFHLFLPINGSIELAIRAEKFAATTGQAYFMEKGTPHGFKNTGNSPAMAFEVFVRDPAPVAQDAKQDALESILRSLPVR